MFLESANSVYLSIKMNLVSSLQFPFVDSLASGK